MLFNHITTVNEDSPPLLFICIIWPYIPIIIISFIFLEEKFVSTLDPFYFSVSLLLSAGLVRIRESLASTICSPFAGYDSQWYSSFLSLSLKEWFNFLFTFIKVTALYLQGLLSIPVLLKLVNKYFIERWMKLKWNMKSE